MNTARTMVVEMEPETNYLYRWDLSLSGSKRENEKNYREPRRNLFHTQNARCCVFFMLVAMKKNLNNFTSIFIFSLSGSFHFLFSVFLFFPQRLHSSEWWSVHVTIWCMRAAAAREKKRPKNFDMLFHLLYVWDWISLTSFCRHFFPSLWCFG